MSLFSKFKKIQIPVNGKLRTVTAIKRTDTEGKETILYTDSTIRYLATFKVTFTPVKGPQELDTVLSGANIVTKTVEVGYGEPYNIVVSREGYDDVTFSGIYTYTKNNIFTEVVEPKKYEVEVGTITNGTGKLTYDWVYYGYDASLVITPNTGYIGATLYSSTVTNGKIIFADYACEPETYTIKTVITFADITGPQSIDPIGKSKATKTEFVKYGESYSFTYTEEGYEPITIDGTATANVSSTYPAIPKQYRATTGTILHGTGSFDYDWVYKGYNITQTITGDEGYTSTTRVLHTSDATNYVIAFGNYECVPKTYTFKATIMFADIIGPQELDLVGTDKVIKTETITHGVPYSFTYNFEGYDSVTFDGTATSNVTSTYPATPTKYTVSEGTITNGSSSVDYSWVYKGYSVTQTITGNSGYDGIVRTLHTSDASNNVITFGAYTCQKTAYTLTATVSNGSITFYSDVRRTNPITTADFGTTVYYTLTAADHYEFTTPTGNFAVTTTNKGNAGTFSADAIIFTLTPPSIAHATVSVNPSSGSYASLRSYTAAAKKYIYITVVPDSNYLVSGTNPYDTVWNNWTYNDTTKTATFNYPSYLPTVGLVQYAVSASITYGSITCSPSTAVDGATITLTAYTRSNDSSYIYDWGTIPSGWTASGTAYVKQVTLNSSNFTYDYVNYKATYNGAVPTVKRTNVNQCFEAGTKVLLADYSEKNIEDLMVGDQVIAYNRLTKDFEVELVEDVYSKYTDQCVDLILDDNTLIQTTTSHPFFTTDGWVSLTPEHDYHLEGEDLAYQTVSMMTIGQNFVCMGSDHKPITKQLVNIIYKQNVPRDHIVYNLDISHCNTFIANGCVVHNGMTK